MACLVLLSLSIATPAQEAPSVSPAQVLAAEQKLDLLSRLAEDDSASLSSLAELATQVESVRAIAQKCILTIRADLEWVAQREQALVVDIPAVPTDAAPATGPPKEAPDEATGDGSAAPIEQLRNSVRKEREALEARIAKCQLLRLQSDELAADLLRREQVELATRLLVRDMSFFEVIRYSINEPRKWLVGGRRLLRLLTGIEELGWIHFGGLLVAALAATLIGNAWRRKPLEVRGDPAQAPLTTNLLTGLRAVARRYAIPVMVIVTVSVYLALLPTESDSLPFITELFYGLLIFMLLAMMIRLLFNPPPPALATFDIAPTSRAPISRQLQFLAFLFLFGFLLKRLAALQVIELPMLLLVADIYVLLMALVGVTLLGHLQKGLRKPLKGTHHGAIVVMLLIILVVAWLGYRNLTRLLFWGTIGTIVGLMLTLLVSRLIDDLQNGFDEGRYGWQRTVRGWFGLKEGDPVPALGWLSVLLQLSAWGLFGYALLLVWGLPGQIFEEIGHLFVSGFSVGNVHIIPRRLLGALAILFVLLALTRWLQTRLERSWLVRTRMERGAREALATSFGYVGIAGAILLTLATAGIEFSNLAIIAGALSVGIGFGLQNVVNNFISGLIMLFERPVKTGDWIQVGATEGYVRRISIRTTLIQTFERSDVIVPNSELISSQVTNWMLHNTYGRITVPIGVAYGSDTEKVQELLLGIARDHPQVVKGFPAWPDPWVLFRAFGESSLDFELRAIIYNVDIRLRVVSDINFAIDKAFREHGIEIPFPQRDVHLIPSTAAATPVNGAQGGGAPGGELPPGRGAG